MRAKTVSNRSSAAAALAGQLANWHRCASSLDDGAADPLALLGAFVRGRERAHAWADEAVASLVRYLQAATVVRARSVARARSRLVGRNRSASADRATFAVREAPCGRPREPEIAPARHAAPTRPAPTVRLPTADDAWPGDSDTNAILVSSSVHFDAPDPRAGWNVRPI
jgi:hypothetical protein